MLMIEKLNIGIVGEEIKWHGLHGVYEKYLPQMWLNPPKEALESGHGGGDYFVMLDWVNAIMGKSLPPIGIHEAMDMTLPGLISSESVAEDGAWLPVPDSRSWVAVGSPRTP